MKIDRATAQKMISKILSGLRNAARKERQNIIREQKKDPVNHSFMAARGYFPLEQNQKLQAQIQELNVKTAKSVYSSSRDVYDMNLANEEVNFVNAGSIL